MVLGILMLDFIRGMVDYESLVTHLGHRTTIHAPIMGKIVSLECLDCGIIIEEFKSAAYEQELRQFALTH
jgi:hypothetical protein